MTPRDSIVDFVRRNANPDARSLFAEVADPTEVLTYLLRCLTEFPIQIDNGGGSELKLSADTLRLVNALLAAVRVHEVESVDWVYLPPEMRASLVHSHAEQSKVSDSQFRSLMNRWIQQ